MFVQTKALVLHSLKYNDSSLIVHCYTQEVGRQSFLVKGVLSSRKGRFRKALFQPLMLLDLSFQMKKKGGLNFIKDVKVVHPYNSCYTEITKNAQLLFLAEMLHKTLQEEAPNPMLFEYLENALLWLDTNEQMADFHLLFLIQLTKFLGFFPHAESTQCRYFNLENGCFTNTLPDGNYLEGPTVERLQSFLGMKFADIKEQKNERWLRREMLGTLINYYRFHIDGFNPPKSLDVLEVVFN